VHARWSERDSEDESESRSESETEKTEREIERERERERKREKERERERERKRHTNLFHLYILIPLLSQNKTHIHFFVAFHIACGGFVLSSVGPCHIKDFFCLSSRI